MFGEDSKITHVIFDLDGLLIDSETCYTTMNEEICQRYGKHFTVDIKRKQMGRKPDEARQVLIDELQLPITLDELRNIAIATEETCLRTATALPGANRLIDHLHANSVPMCIATGSDQRGFTVKTTNIPEIIEKMSHNVLAGSDPEVRHGKPSPECFVVAAERFGSKPKSSQNVLVFEDAANGVRAGLAAGMRVVWVPSVAESESELAELSHNPDVSVLRSLTEFTPENYGLPAFTA